MRSLILALVILGTQFCLAWGYEDDPKTDSAWREYQVRLNEAGKWMQSDNQWVEAKMQKDVALAKIIKDLSGETLKNVPYCFATLGEYLKNCALSKKEQEIVRMDILMNMLAEIDVQEYSQVGSLLYEKKLDETAARLRVLRYLTKWGKANN